MSASPAPQAVDADVGPAAGAVDEAGGADERARLPPAMAATHSRDDRPVVIDVLDHDDPRRRRECAKPRRSSNTPPSRSTKIAWHAEMPRRLVARNDAADGRRDHDVDRAEPRRGSSPPAPGTAARVRAGSWKTRIFCRNTGLRSPDDRMKCPSRSAPALAEFVENLVLRRSPYPVRRRAQPFTRSTLDTTRACARSCGDDGVEVLQVPDLEVDRRSRGNPAIGPCIGGCRCCRRCRR